MLPFLLFWPPSAWGQGALTNGGNHDGQISVAGEVESWTFSASAGEMVWLRASRTSGNAAFGPRLRIFDAAGNLVGLDATPRQTFSQGVVFETSARIDFMPASTGMFTARVDATTPTATGAYRVHFLEIPGSPVVPTGDQGGPLTNGGRHDGTITVGDLDA